jgi:uncharacterized protein
MTTTGQKLPQILYLAFPFRIGREGSMRATRMAHLRQQVEQVIFTSPGERVFRPEFGFGARAYVFEPNRAEVWEVAQNRLYASLAETLAGEVDPKTLRVEIGADQGSPERMMVRISYIIAALQQEEHHEFGV